MSVRDNFISLALLRDLAREKGTGASHRVVFAERGGDIAYVAPFDGDRGNANARLIAAAPALLANLRLAIWHLENPAVPMTADALANLRAALASALPTDARPVTYR